MPPPPHEKPRTGTVRGSADSVRSISRQYPTRRTGDGYSLKKTRENTKNPVPLHVAYSPMRRRERPRPAGFSSGQCLIPATVRSDVGCKTSRLATSRLLTPPSLYAAIPPPASRRRAPLSPRLRKKRSHPDRHQQQPHAHRRTVRAHRTAPSRQWRRRQERRDTGRLIHQYAII